MVKILDAIALSALEEPGLSCRIAALWCREFNNRCPYSSTEITRWAKQEFGPLLENSPAVSRKLLEETKRQIRLRTRRRKRSHAVDVLTTPGGSQERQNKLLRDRLGPARLWADKSRSHGLGWSDYMDGGVYSGVVTGLIPVEMRVGRFYNPNLLVYRRGYSEPQTRFVPGHITSVADAFIWLIPLEVAEFLHLPQTKVEHNPETQCVRLITQFGEKELPWRSLSSD